MIFETRVNGIPCQCKVTDWQPYIPAPLWGERLDPPEEEYFEYTLLDRKGYPAAWLHKYITPTVDERLRDEFLALRSKELFNYEHRKYHEYA